MDAHQVNIRSVLDLSSAPVLCGTYSQRHTELHISKTSQGV